MWKKLKRHGGKDKKIVIFEMLYLSELRSKKNHCEASSFYF